MRILYVACFVALAVSLTSATQPVQYTPDQADWSTFYSKPMKGGTNTGHDPDGVGWISRASWEAARWDGTVYNPSAMTKQELAAALCPSVDRVRGIRELFYRQSPPVFANRSHPTRAEVDAWHALALTHVRALVGYNTSDRAAKPDTCMHARALWGQQRKFTSLWDAYGGKENSAYGPCTGGNSHCGATFIPNATDQAPYLPQGHSGCSTQAGSEGIFSGPKSNIPWSIKWSRGFCITLASEGFWGGHTGPWFHREKFGFSFWDNDPNNNDNNCVLRAKWTGKLSKNLYCNPAKDPACNASTSTTLFPSLALFVVSLFLAVIIY